MVIIMKKGFTLIEMLAIIIIISVLVAIATPRFLDLLEGARRESRDKVYEMIESAARIYSGDYNIKEVDSEITIQKLCEREYLVCPIYDPLTDKEITGFIRIEEDPSFEGALRYIYYEE